MCCATSICSWWSGLDRADSVGSRSHMVPSRWRGHPRGSGARSHGGDRALRQHQRVSRRGRVRHERIRAGRGAGAPCLPTRAAGELTSRTVGPPGRAPLGAGPRCGSGSPGSISTIPGLHWRRGTARCSIGCAALSPEPYRVRIMAAEVVVAALLAAVLMVMVAALVWQEAKRRARREPRVYVLSDAVAFVRERLPSDVAVRHRRGQGAADPGMGGLLPAGSGA